MEDALRELLGIQINWKKIAPGKWSSFAKGRPCNLVMNDFPEEPLYTVSIDGLSLDIDEPPSCWRIE
jgi:hypothetical protein